MRYDERELRVDGRTTLLYGGGSGEPLLYLHGVVGDVHCVPGDGTWPPFLAALARNFAVHAPAHPGFGGSETSPLIDSVEDYAFHYADLLDALAIERAHVVGFSFGGWLAAELAVRHPHRIATLSLLAALGLALDNAAIGPLFGALAPRGMGGNDEGRRLLFADADGAAALAALPDEPSREQRLAMLRALEGGARIGWSPPYFQDRKLLGRLARIGAPTLVVWGDVDALAPLAHAQAFAGGIRGARLAVVPGAGHSLTLEQPERVADEVMAFVKDAGVQERR